MNNLEEHERQITYDLTDLKVRATNARRIFDLIKFTLFFLFIAFSFSVASAQQDQNLFEIEPGYKVGAILMTMRINDIQALYGDGAVYVVPDPDKSFKFQLLQYGSLGLDILFKNDRIDEIYVSQANYYLKGGLKVGSVTALVEETLGKSYLIEDSRNPERPDVPDYKMIYSGIIFHIKNGKVLKIIVKRMR
jgi:hypothetical protein